MLAYPLFLCPTVPEPSTPVKSELLTGLVQETNNDPMNTRQKGKKIQEVALYRSALCSARSALAPLPPSYCIQT